MIKIDWYSFILGAAVGTTISGLLWDQVRRMYSRRLRFLIYASDAVMDANAQEIECRHDEDCNHCVAISAIHWAKGMFQDTPAERASEGEKK